MLKSAKSRVTLAIKLAIALVVAFYIFCVNHVSNQAIGIAQNVSTGEVTVMKSGWHVTGPQVQVASVSTLPTQVCLNSGARLLNCKLVRFKEVGVQDFVREQGFHYYGGTALSQQNGCLSGCTGMANILKGYAYSGKSWPFLEILEEISPQKSMPQ